MIRIRIRAGEDTLIGGFLGKIPTLTRGLVIMRRRCSVNELTLLKNGPCT